MPGASVASSRAQITSGTWKEVVISIAGKKHWLWRAVHQNGYVLDKIVQNKRNANAAKRLLTRLMKKQGMVPKRIITDKLHSYRAADAKSRQVLSTDHTRV
jgi:putative transposase